MCRLLQPGTNFRHGGPRDNLTGADQIPGALKCVVTKAGDVRFHDKVSPGAGQTGVKSYSFTRPKYKQKGEKPCLILILSPEATP